MVIIRRLEARFCVRDSGVPPASSNPEAAVSELLRELEALRARLDHAQEWFNRPQDTIKAGGLAEEVKRLCQDATRGGDAAEVAELLSNARRRLDELQALLGSH